MLDFRNIERLNVLLIVFFRRIAEISHSSLLEIEIVMNHGIVNILACIQIFFNILKYFRMFDANLRVLEGTRRLISRI